MDVAPPTKGTHPKLFKNQPYFPFNRIFKILNILTMIFYFLNMKAMHLIDHF